jgi:formate dehydrogenase maturation protein FdhE
MSPALTSLTNRIARAWLLARERPATADLLTFYGDLAGLQQQLLGESPRVVRSEHRAFADALNAEVAATLVDSVLRWLDARPQKGLAGLSPSVFDRSTERWAQLLDGYWRLGGVSLVAVDEVEQFVAEALLQPFAESVALPQHAEVRASEASYAIPKGTCQCPVCGGHPIVGTLRERGHGSRRSLVCGFCLTEWATPRAVCPFCSESGVDALLVYRAEEFPDIRIEACRTCQNYIKTVDLTVNGAAIPIVDDLASLAMDLWAAGRGYRKVRPNLLRL